MLNTDPRKFPESGYCLYRDVFNRAQVEKMRQSLQVATLAGLSGLPNYYGEPHTTDVFWLETCIHPRLLDAVDSVLGPNLVLVFSSMFIKQPRDDRAVCWHQDKTFWPSVHGTGVVTVWLAIDNVAEENAPLQLIPGSHQGHCQLETVEAGAKEWLSKKVEITPRQEASAVSMTMSAGSLSIHDSHLIHGGGINHSDRRRAGYTIRFCSTDTAWVDVGEHPIPVYLVRGEAGLRGKDYTDRRP